MDISLIASRIKQLIKEKGTSANKVSIECGISKSFLYDIEKRNMFPSLPTVAGLRDYFNVSADWIIGISNEKIIGIKKEPTPEFEEKALVIGQYLLDKGIVPDLSDESLSVVLEFLEANEGILKKIIEKHK